ncbi:hypothetical protein DCAR_0521636 [Daucus carota subsp. sativus]|uniref:Two-component response regulator n=1 Tax=Daucus carota subsp. sativus TaxID=79200 RepID=A0AAF0X856_DAUCS|nr:hypothetical protein DCAR_0521636 [Daucus carota subsp. sativus]
MSENNTSENSAGDGTPMPENPKFPEGLRVLLVDDDPTSLKTVSAMLQKCKYRVTPVTIATEALALLRANKDDYDLVMTDVRMPDMDGFELLKIIGLEMDIPVIMMSVDDKRENVMKGVMHGARDYLVKPIRILELQNIWQHVLRKTALDPEKSSLITEEIVVGNLPLKKRQGKDKEKEDANAISDGSCSMKKRRFAWTQELHQKFVEAVHHLNADKAVPKQIVDIMKEPGLTREIVASHLQKYRNYLKREQMRMTESGVYNNGQKGIHEAYLNPTPTSYSDYRPILRDPNNGCSSGSGTTSFRDHLPKPEALTNSQLNDSFMIGSLNQQSLWSQQTYNPPHMPNQVQAPKPTSVLGNIPLAQAQQWVANPPGRVMFGDYVNMSSQIPNFGTVQAGPQLGFANFAGQSGFPPSKLPSTENALHPGPSGAFGIVGAPYQMLDGASNQISQPFQRNVLPGNK